MIGLLPSTLLAALAFLHLNWTLFPVVVVAESSLGFTTLRRSASLVRGMHGVTASLLAFLGLSADAIAWVDASLTAGLGVSCGWESHESVVLIALASAFMTVVLLYSVAANAVLYMHCKAVHGELAAEIAKEFPAKYVCLPFDREKVPRLVSIACA